MKIILIDNYDSFTYNLVHMIEGITGDQVDVFKNDVIQLNDINQYDKIILSPGPGIPEEAGMLQEIIRQYSEQKTMLGVCLGHQAIAEVFGGKLKNLDTVYHGIATTCTVTKDCAIFQDIPEKFPAGRYHSWITEHLPEELEVTAVDENGLIMAFQHRQFDITGVQFHPESVLTPHGESMMRNWLYK